MMCSAPRRMMHGAHTCASSQLLGRTSRTGSCTCQGELGLAVDVCLALPEGESLKSEAMGVCGVLGPFTWLSGLKCIRKLMHRKDTFPQGVNPVWVHVSPCLCGLCVCVVSFSGEKCGLDLGCGSPITGFRCGNCFGHAPEHLPGCFDYPAVGVLEKVSLLQQLSAKAWPAVAITTVVRSRRGHFQLPSLSG